MTGPSCVCVAIWFHQPRRVDAGLGIRKGVAPSFNTQRLTYDKPSPVDDPPPTQPNAQQLSPNQPSPAQRDRFVRNGAASGYRGLGANRTYARNDFVQDGLGIGGFVKLRGCPNTVLARRKKRRFAVFAFAKLCLAAPPARLDLSPTEVGFVEGAAYRFVAVAVAQEVCPPGFSAQQRQLIDVSNGSGVTKYGET
ncbi:hypothetical protein Q7P35_011026 [Cladosporium inversicolor]